MKTRIEPTIKEVNVVKTLTNVVIINGQTITEVNIKKLILRPILKRIIFITEEFEKTVVYEGEIDFEAHKADSEDTLIGVFLAKIYTEYKK